jgi:hypothetical protein
MLQLAFLRLCVSLLGFSFDQVPDRNGHHCRLKQSFDLRYALVFSLFCARLRVAASVVPVQSSSLLIACTW